MKRHPGKKYPGGKDFYSMGTFEDYARAVITSAKNTDGTLEKTMKATGEKLEAEKTEAERQRERAYTDTAAAIFGKASEE